MFCEDMVGEIVSLRRQVTDMATRPMPDEIDENSSEADIVTHALVMAVDVAGPSVKGDDLEPEDVASWAFCEMICAAVQSGDFTKVRAHLAEP